MVGHQHRRPFRGRENMNGARTYSVEIVCEVCPTIMEVRSSNRGLQPTQIMRLEQAVVFMPPKHHRTVKTIDPFGSVQKFAAVVCLKILGNETIHQMTSESGEIIGGPGDT